MCYIINSQFAGVNDSPILPDYFKFTLSLHNNLSKLQTSGNIRNYFIHALRDQKKW